MHYKLRISKSARRDIDHALIHTSERFGERQHHRYKLLIRDALKAIGRQPDGWPAKSQAELRPNLWTFHIARRGKPARHFFLYRIVGEFVQVERFLHDSMDLDRHVSEPFESPE